MVLHGVLLKLIIHPLALRGPNIQGWPNLRGFLLRTAVLIDGGFFLKQYKRLQGDKKPEEVAEALHQIAFKHLERKSHDSKQPPKRNYLYRIFYYDCPPLEKKAHYPTTGQAIDFSKTDLARWKWAFFRELRKRRKVALRMGSLSERTAEWVLHAGVLKDLLAQRITVDQLTEQHVKYDIRQKGVDMRIGLDIASLAYKRQVDQIVLIAGDSDFVPAAKLARREGIDFVLDPMWASIQPDLHEHIDGLQSVLSRPVKNPPISDSESPATTA